MDDQTLVAYGEQYSQRRIAANEARKWLKDAVLQALAEGKSEVRVAQLAKVDRMTVRKWSGK